MTIKVEGVHNGRKSGFRMTNKNGNRETLYCEELNADFPSKKALDIWENVYGYKRRNIRFIHR